MKVRRLCAIAALVALAAANRALAETPTYEDGSEADVFYVAGDTGETAAGYYGEAVSSDTDAMQAVAVDQIPTETFEPGSANASSFAYNGSLAQDYGCANDGCTNCSPYRHPNPAHGYWARGEYLMWWMSGAVAPPLVTTSPDGTPINEAGILPDAEILFPTERLGTNGRPGGRFTVGYWLDDAESWGIEGSYFFLDKGGNGFQASSDDAGSPILARPFVDADTDTEDAFLVAYPDVFAGTITVAPASDVLGAEANIRYAMSRHGNSRLDFLAGYRFLRVSESISIYENQIAIDPAGIIPFGTAISIQDNFSTRNYFNGGQVGMVWQKDCRRWSFEGTGKVAFGSWNQQVQIGGFTSIAIPNDPVVVEEGGLLALGSNSGNYQRDRFAAIPEVGLNVRYQMTDCWKVNVGYTFMYLSNIVRPGNNIDREIDVDQIPPPIDTGAFPQFKFKESDAWLQGLNVGVECRF